MGNAAPILALRPYRDDTAADLSDMTEDSITSIDRAAALHALWFKMADTAIRVGDLVMLQKALARLEPTMAADVLETLSTTAAAVGHAACLRTVVEFAAGQGMLLHLRAAHAAASFHGRTECSIYLRDLMWPTSAVALHQQRLCELLGIEFRDLESGAYHLARSSRNVCFA